MHNVKYFLKVFNLHGDTKMSFRHVPYNIFKQKTASIIESLLTGSVKKKKKKENKQPQDKIMSSTYNFRLKSNRWPTSVGMQFIKIFDTQHFYSQM